VLLVCAVALFVFVLRSIKKSKIRIEDSLFWIVLSVLILIMAAIPEIGYFASKLLRFQAPVNFVFLAAIAVLLVKCFTTSIHVSQLETKVKELTQQIAIRDLDRDLEGRDSNADKAE
jgi:hypothetical protein